jgi:hypothetical protein
MHGTNVANGHVGGRLLLRYYDLYQRLQLKFYVLLMMGARSEGSRVGEVGVSRGRSRVAP